MEITEISKVLLKETADISVYWINAIRSYMHEHRITQNQLAQKLLWSQTTISKKLNKNNMGNLSETYWHLSFQDANSICQAMDSTLGVVMYEYDQRNKQNSQDYSSDGSQEFSGKSLLENIPKQCRDIPSEEYPVYPSCLFAEDANLVNRKTDPMFSPWFGTFHCYFFSTLSNEDTCFHGILEIPKLPMEGCCHVKFSFDFGVKKKQTKDYYGQLVLSRKPNGGAYCTLVNHDDLGEISFLLMANPVVNHGSVCCAVALVATISGGKDTKHPCAERMIISRIELNGARFELIKAHLLLNDKNIRISEKAFLDMLDDDSTPQEFKQNFKTECPFDEKPLSTYLSKTAIIPENWVKSLTNFSAEDRQLIIDLLRLYSSAPKYNKIKQKTAEYDIFNLFREEFEPWTLPLELDD